MKKLQYHRLSLFFLDFIHATQRKKIYKTVISGKEQI